MSDGDGADRRSGRGIPIGVERVLYTAAVDADFLEALLRDPETAARARGLELRASELAVLRHTPGDRLRATVRSMDTSPASLERRTFLGVVAAGAAVASLAGCGEDDDPTRGIRPDAWPDTWPDADDPTRGIRPDAVSPDAGPAEAGADTVAPPDLASYGIRPGG
jgi:hypothetical protein